MKRPIVVALILMAFVVLARNQASKGMSSTQAPSKPESEIKEAIRERLDALRRGDSKAYLSYFGEDCLMTSDGGAISKPEAATQEWSGIGRYGISYKGSEPLDVEVHVYGDIAVARFRLELDEDWSGQKLYGAVRLTDVFIRRGGRWLVVAHQETPIPYARRVAAKVDPAVFDAYAGEYQITPSYVVKVKREGDKLMDLYPDDPGYSEDVPISDSIFFARGESGEVIYVKDASGKVSHFILRTPTGDLIAKKIK